MGLKPRWFRPVVSAAGRFQYAAVSAGFGEGSFRVGLPVVSAGFGADRGDEADEADETDLGPTSAGGGDRAESWPDSVRIWGFGRGHASSAEVDRGWAEVGPRSGRGPGLRRPRGGAPAGVILEYQISALGSMNGTDY